MRARENRLVDVLYRARGASVLALLAFFSIAALAVFLGALKGSDPRTGADRITTRAMAQAKQGLLDWAASNISQPGQLPCPEDLALVGSPMEGSAMATCPVPVTGRLPWRTLGLPDLRDANNDKLWYALSAGFRNAPINSASQAQLTVDAVANRAVAIVFSPGTALPGQQRAPGSPPVLADYLEDLNSGGTNTFTTRGSAGAFNDKLLLVTKADLMRVVEARVAGEVALRLRGFFRTNLYFPYAAQALDSACKQGLAAGYVPQSAGDCTHPAFADPLTAPLPAWFGANNWTLYVSYKAASGCLQPTPGTVDASGTPDCGGPGRLTVGANTAVKASLTISNRNYLIQ